MPQPARRDDYVGRTLNDAAGAGHGLIAGVAVILLICGGLTFIIGLVTFLGPVGIVLLIIGTPVAYWLWLVSGLFTLPRREARERARCRDASPPSSF